MPDTRKIEESLKTLLDDVFAEGGETARRALARYLEMEKSLFESFQESVHKNLSRDSMTDSMQDFTKMMMASWMELAAFQRESQQRFLELQSGMANRYLGFLEKLKKALEGSDDGSGESSPDEG